jgi:MerR family transcriptional regulator/heat shock protein HspR
LGSVYYRVKVIYSWGYSITAWEKNHKIERRDNPEWHEPIVAIGAAAEKVGLSVSALRKYEREGLALFHRTPTGRRMLSQADIKRVEAIQHMVKHLGLNLEGIRRLLAILPCWKLKPCTLEERDQCPAYLDSVRPCWALAESECARQGADCRLCNVYRYGANFAEDIKTLLHWA